MKKLIALFLVGVLFSVPIFGATSPTYAWDLDDGSGTIATASHGSKDLTFVCGETAPVWSTDVPTFGDGVTTGGSHSVKIGGSNGDGKLHTSGIKPSDFPGGFTVNFWLKGKGLAINWHSLVQFQFANWHIQVDEINGGTLRYQVGCGSEICPNGVFHDREFTGTGWDKDVWSMITVMQNATHDCGYMDGELLGCFLTTHFAGHRDDLMLGGERFPADCRGSFDGNIDEVQIFTQFGGLSGEEVRNLYLHGTTDSPEPDEIPEFTTLGMLIVLGGAGYFIFRRRR